jgi:hypothetical protein
MKNYHKINGFFILIHYVKILKSVLARAKAYATSQENGFLNITLYVKRLFLKNFREFYPF